MNVYVWTSFNRVCMVANPNPGQLNREFLPPCLRLRLIISSRKTGSAVPSRVSTLILHTQAESGAAHALFSFPPLPATASVYTVNRHRVSLEFIGSRNRVQMAFAATSTGTGLSKSSSE